MQTTLLGQFWSGKTEITALASGKPPIDDGSEHMILDAIEESSKARFFVQAARDIDWLDWLDSRNVFDGLFSETVLTEEQRILADWLTRWYVLEHAEKVISIFARHQLRISAQFWSIVGQKIASSGSEGLSRNELKKWVIILLATAPVTSQNQYVLLPLAEACSKQGIKGLLIRIFLLMATPKLELRKSSSWGFPNADKDEGLEIIHQISSEQWYLGSLYNQFVFPALDELAIPLFRELASQLERLHATNESWAGSDKIWDEYTYSRSAIEPHSQDHSSQPRGVVIDAVRDAFTRMFESSLDVAKGFFAQYSKTKVPILRRICFFQYAWQTRIVSFGHKSQQHSRNSK